MKIAFVVSHFPSLSEVFILDQITALIDAGHEVDIYANSPDPGQQSHPDIEKYGLLEKVYYLPSLSNRYHKKLATTILILFNNIISRPSLLFEIYSKISRSSCFINRTYLLEGCAYLTIDKIRTQNYDVIHCHFAPNLIRGWIIKNINPGRPKLGVTFHGNDVNNRKWICKKKEYRSLIPDIDFYTSNTNFTADKAEKLGFPREKIVILPVGFELAKYNFVASPIKQDDTVRILTVARLVEKKGLEYSIQAVAKVLEKFPNIIYHIVGDGILRTSLEDLVRKLDLEKKILFLGWKKEDEVRELYRKSHIFILPSVTARDGDMEGQGLVLQEAQAVGIPVISTLHNGIPDGVLDGRSGFLVPERDMTAIAEKIQLLIENPFMGESMGKVGMEFVKQNYDVRYLSRKLLNVYQEAL